MKKEIFVSGRVELAGNHTDHQNGRILASAIDRGLYAQAQPCEENRVLLHSKGFPDIEVKLNQLTVRTQEFGTPQALLRGVLAVFQELGLNIGGFTAQIRSTLPAGSSTSCITTMPLSPSSWPGWPSRRKTASSASPAAS